MESKTLRTACPECGEQFTPRGLSGHRRLRHGVSPAPASALPRDSELVTEAITAIMSAIVGLQDAVLRVEQRVIAIRNVAVQAESPAAESERLSKELSDLLHSIARLKQTGLAATTIRRPASDAEKRASQELARLRREQARVVFRLDELRNGKASDDRFLS